ncbi:hypothetical protein GCM10010112_19000 [Actinoplanes lobatus]|uniref:Uncharacterized protein n=1 Tax=Actinoplanes lobatus TaxID=113568 RepID=A0ABQ4AK21_9ACTN|nr:hypothetical protein GCM10010112_19000 [Actinoplanes lobatus]GIE41349.1 hypothetical protein Alo02nite_42470 [Actinoplanes lobatus]
MTGGKEAEAATGAACPATDLRPAGAAEAGMGGTGRMRRDEDTRTGKSETRTSITEVSWPWALFQGSPG